MALNLTAGTPTPETCEKQRWDINEDGAVDLKDYSLLCAHMDESSSCSANIPSGERLEKLQKPWTQWEKRPFIWSSS
jgi:hypothetical protein